MFKSGEVAYYMNDNGKDSIWCQSIGEDTYPTPRSIGKQAIILESQIDKNTNSYIEVSDEGEFIAAVYNNYQRLKLTQDITLSSGTCLLSTHELPFCGAIDGDGHALIGDGKECKVSDNGGLFGKMQHATIKNLTLRNFNMKGGDKVGVLVGEAYNTTFTNVTVEGNSKTYAAGKQTAAICGYAEKCEFDSCTTAKGVKIYCDGPNAHDNAWAGGICGQAFDSNFRYCTNNAEIESDDDRLAGIVGDLCRGEIIGCVNTADIHHENWSGWTGACDEAAGIVAFANNVTIERCQNNGRINCADEYAGGIVGQTYNTTVIKNCLNTAIVYTRNGSSAGAIVGKINKESSVYNCMTTGHVQKNDDIIYKWCGGEEEEGRTIENCYYRYNGQGNVEEADIKSGALAWKLNGQTADGSPAWHQAIGLDDVPSPVFSQNNTVYSLTNCFGEDIYSNTKPADGETGAHNFVDGVCIYCGWSTKDTISISSVKEYMDYAENVNSNHPKHAVLTADLDFTGEAFMPVGTDEHPFTLSFDGQGHTVTLDIQNQASDYVALFRNVSGATIRNLHINGNITTSARYAAGIVAKTGGNGETRIENCEAAVTINSTYNGDAHHGGLVADNEAKTLTIDNCLFDGQLNYNATTTGCGGLIGWNSAANTTCNVSNTLQAGTFLNTRQSAMGNTLALYETTEPAYSYTYRYCSIAGVLVADMAPGDVQCGAMAFLLNGAKSTDNVLWRQNIGHDAYPVLCLNSADKDAYPIVYHGSTCMSGDTYSNTVIPDDASDQHTIVSGVCTKCGYAENGIRQIANADDFVKFANSVNNGASQNAVLTADIDLTTASFTPAGAIDGKPFTGIFDGQGHTVTIALSDISNDYAALFSRIQDAQLKNLRVAGTISTSAKYAGGIVGAVLGSDMESSETFITNCASTVDITSTVEGEGRHGGIAGYSSANLHVENCLFQGIMELNNKTTLCAGIVGYATKGRTLSIDHCLQRGSFLQAPDNAIASDFAGYYNGDINNSFAYYFVNSEASGANAALASGAMTFALNEATSLDDAVWRQNLDTNADFYPQLCITDEEKAAHGVVYCGTTCGNLTIYANAPLDYSDVHSYNLNKVCIICGYEDGGVRHIATLSDLEDFADFVNKGYSHDAVLTADIDASAHKQAFFTEAYSGTFDGQGHTITIAAENTDNAFFNTLSDATVKNLCVKGSATVSNGPTSAIAAFAEGNKVEISNCVADVTLTPQGNNPCGGFIGESSASLLTFEDCLFNGTFDMSQTTDAPVAGFVGQATAAVGIFTSLQTASLSGTATTASAMANAADNNVYTSFFLNAFSDADNEGNQGEQTTLSDICSGTLAAQLKWGQTLRYGNDAAAAGITAPIADAMPSPFASSICYDMPDGAEQMGALVLPFDFYTDTYADSVEFYGYKGKDFGGNITVEKKDGLISAGTPFIYKFKSDSNDMYRLCITSNDWAVSAHDSSLVCDTINAIALTGTFSQRDITAKEGYIITGGDYKSIAEQQAPVVLMPYQAFFDITAAPIIFSDETVTADDISDVADNDLHDITIGRTFYKDGYYNTLCLPFALTAEQLAAGKFAGATLKKVSGLSLKGTEPNLTAVIELEDATSIEAGQPYLIKWTEDTENPTIVSPAFYNVTVSSTESSKVTGTGINCVASYCPVDFTMGDESKAFLGAQNKVFFASENGQLKGFRCYFELTDASLSTRSLTFVLDDGTATGIGNVSRTADTTDSTTPAFSVQGIRVNGSYKGIIIQNGRKHVSK